MKLNVERNSPVAFVGNRSFYPDLLFREAKIIIEIDGSIHLIEERQKSDKDRDRIFQAHGYDIIRIVNEDVCFSVSFWLRLKEGLSRIEPVGNKSVVQDYIDELDACVKNFNIQCLNIDEGEENYSLFPKSRSKMLQNIKNWHKQYSFFD